MAQDFQSGVGQQVVLTASALQSVGNEQREALMLLSASVGLGRPFFMPPETPADRVGAIRKAFDATLADPEFLKEAQTMNLDIRYMSGARLSELVNSIVDAPDSVAEKVRSAYGREAGSAP